MQPARGEVHITPAQRAQLADPQPRERERGEDRATLDVAALLRAPRVQFAGRVQQGRDLLAVSR